MEGNVIDLGRKLMENCPDNDCVVYRNTFKMWREVTEDYFRVKNEHCKRILKCEGDRLMRELERMYISNYAVNQYRRAAQ